MKHSLCVAVVLLMSVGYTQAAEVPFVELKGHTDEVNFVTFSPDGKKIVTASKDHTARIWSAESGKELHRLVGHTEKLFSADFSPDGKRIVTASEDKTARVWDVGTGKELKKFSGGDGRSFFSSIVRFASFSSDGKEIVAALDKIAVTWDAESGKVRQRLEGHTTSAPPGVPHPSTRIASAVFSPDGKRIVTAGSSDTTIRVWDAKSGKELHQSYPTGLGTRFATFSPDGTKIVSANGTQIFFWTADLRDCIQNFAWYKNPELDWIGGVICSVNFSPNGKKIVVAARDSRRRVASDGTIITRGEAKPPRIVDIESGKVLQKLEGHTGQVLYNAFSPDGEKIVTASEDNTARIWDLSAVDALDSRYD